MGSTRPPLFNTGSTSSSTLYTTSSSSSAGNTAFQLADEIDLRAEFDALMFGSGQDHRHGHPVAIRHLRRTTEGAPIACECKDLFSGEADPDCSYCSGEGWLWDEQWYICRSQYLGSEGGLANRYRHPEPGQIRADYKVFFFRYDVPLRYGDKIVEMLLDDDGNPVVPYVREAIYKPQTINKLRSDNGRAEFITVHCLERDAIRSDTLQ